MAQNQDKPAMIPSSVTLVDMFFMDNEPASGEKATKSFDDTHFRKTLNNEVASAKVIYALPAAEDVGGKFMRVVIKEKFEIRLSPQSGEAIVLNGCLIADKDLIIPGVISNYVVLYSNGSNYIVTMYNGVITKQI